MSRTTQERPLAGKDALVTGGSRGIGAAIAKRLAGDGASVAVTYSKGADAASSVVKEIERGGGKAIAIQADAADADAVRNAVEKTVATLGRLDVLVNNAGTVIPMTVEETTLADFDRVFAINVRGVFVATQAALKHLKTGGGIVMIGSCLGERVFMPGSAPYAATKGAVKMFTQGLARELGARGITVNNVQPGPIDTDLNPASGESGFAKLLEHIGAPLPEATAWVSMLIEILGGLAILAGAFVAVVSIPLIVTMLV